ncbi:MAG: hypothetical protein ACI8Z0_000688, partial [Lentimonas sp.]
MLTRIKSVNANPFGKAQKIRSQTLTGGLVRRVTEEQVSIRP